MAGADGAISRMIRSIYRRQRRQLRAAPPIAIREIRVIRGQNGPRKEEPGDGVHRGWHGSQGWDSTRSRSRLRGVEASTAESRMKFILARLSIVDSFQGAFVPSSLYSRAAGSEGAKTRVEYRRISPESPLADNALNAHPATFRSPFRISRDWIKREMPVVAQRLTSIYAPTFEYTPQIQPPACCRSPAICLGRADHASARCERQAPRHSHVHDLGARP